MSTVFEILNQSLKIKETLKLQAIVVVFDQALYAKATEIKWKHTERFESIVLRMGVFHTICTFLGIIGKRFQYAGLKDICIESGVITEGSVCGVLEGRRYNRAVRFHKLMYEAFMRMAWTGFENWLTENQQSKKRAVDDAVNGLASLYDKICNTEFQDKLKSQSFVELTDFYDQYMDYLRHKNGNLSQFWVSYLDMVEILLGLLRASREGDWKLHLSCVRNMVPWCFAYDNINYARYFLANVFVCVQS